MWQNLKDFMGGGKRKIFLINPAFQKKVIRQAFIMAVFVSMSMLLATFLVVQYLVDSASSYGLLNSELIQEYMTQASTTLYLIYIGLTVAIALAFTASGLFFSHRIAGPIYSLMRHMDRVKNGEKIDALKFRENDFFQDLDDSYNAMLSAHSLLKPASETPEKSEPHI